MDKFILYIHQRLAYLSAMIPLYKGKLLLENWFAFKIISLQIERIEHLETRSTPDFHRLTLSTLVIHLATTLVKYNNFHLSFNPDLNIIFSVIVIDIFPILAPFKN